MRAFRSRESIKATPINFFAHIFGVRWANVIPQFFFLLDSGMLHKLSGHPGTLNY